MDITAATIHIKIQIYTEMFKESWTANLVIYHVFSPSRAV